MTTIGDDTTPTLEPTGGLHVPAGTGRALWGPGDRYDVLVDGTRTGGSLFMIECHVALGGGPPPHIHHRETESFYVLSGSFSVTIDTDRFEAGVGDLIVVPKGAEHSFANTGDEVARMLAVFTPAGMEGYFTTALDDALDRDAVPPPPTPEMIDRMLAAGPEHGVEWVLPKDPTV